MVLAKFYVQTKTEYQGGQISIVMAPVYSDNDENKDWAKYTPSGKLEMMIDNESAAKFFEVGKEYYLRFTHAEK